MDNALLRCPFCGGKGHVSEETKEESGTIMRGHVVWCGGCNCSTELFAEQYDAINAWNTRTTPDEITAKLSRLEIMLYMVVRMKVMSVGLELGKSEDEINHMAYDSMKAMEEIVDWEKGAELLKNVAITCNNLQSDCKAAAAMEKGEWE